jgi:hypothetical protein
MPDVRCVERLGLQGSRLRLPRRWLPSDETQGCPAREGDSMKKDGDSTGLYPGDLVLDQSLAEALQSAVQTLKQNDSPPEKTPPISKKSNTDLGPLVQRCSVPKATGMDALEARVVVVQEVPPKAELHFFAIRGEDRERLESGAAQAILRDLIPRKPITTLTEFELLVEVSSLRADNDRMRPVYEAAKAYRRSQALGLPDAGVTAARRKLTEAIDAALTTEDR